MDNNLVLDYQDQRLLIIINMDPLKLINSTTYKLRLRRYIDRDKSTENIIYMKKELTYPDYKKIITHLQKDSARGSYDLLVRERLSNHITNRELYINERANIGLAIKNQADELNEKFLEYRTLVDNTMIRELREKQAWDSFFMNTMKRSANFSVPGSGKTASVLGVFAYLNNYNMAEKLIMVGPKNSFGSWIDEFTNCFGHKRELNIFNIQDYRTPDEKKHALLYGSSGKNLLLFNYESLRSIIDEIMRLIDDKTLLVFDEVHKVKNVNGERAKDALAISKVAPYIITLTGTPIPNAYIDIKNMLEILYHDEYNEYFGFTEAQLKNPTEEDIEIINNKLQPFFCRTTKEQLQVPAANEDIIKIFHASEAENEIFNILLLKYAKNKLALIIRILQLESNPQMILKAIDINDDDFSEILDTSGEVEDYDYVDYSDEIVDLINSIDKTSKFKACTEQVMELYKKGESVIIWCIFIDSIERLSLELKKRGVQTGAIYGDVGDEERGGILRRFRNREVDVLITNPHTLAESVSLHSVCHNAIYFEYSYNLVHLLQSKDRIHRLGLPPDQYTQYYYLQNVFLTRDNTEYSLDQKIYERLLDKERVMLDAIDKDLLEHPTTIEEDIDLIFKDLIK